MSTPTLKRPRLLQFVIVENLMVTKSFNKLIKAIDYRDAHPGSSIYGLTAGAKRKKARST